MELVTRYRDTAEMCEGGGWEWLGTLVEQVGLPLEVIHIVHDRVYHIDTLDYEEGQARPMTRRSIWWWDVFGQPPSPPVAMPCAIIAVYPDGGRHLVASNEDVN